VRNLCAIGQKTHAFHLSFSLRSVMEVTQLQLLGDNSLTDIIRKLTQPQSDATVEVHTEIGETKVMVEHTLMEDLVHKFSQQMSGLGIAQLEDHHTPSKQIVLLTGSTGALGCHILSHLLARHDVQHVYALNRPSSDGMPLVHRQATALQQQGLPPFEQSPKLTLIAAELEKESFGVSAETMGEVRTLFFFVTITDFQLNSFFRL
jgi:hypothetical protein